MGNYHPDLTLARPCPRFHTLPAPIIIHDSDSDSDCDLLSDEESISPLTQDEECRQHLLQLIRDSTLCEPWEKERGCQTDPMAFVDGDGANGLFIVLVIGFVTGFLLAQLV